MGPRERARWGVRGGEAPRNKDELLANLNSPADLGKVE
jgi:hypothetical protein